MQAPTDAVAIHVQPVDSTMPVAPVAATDSTDMIVAKYFERYTMESGILFDPEDLSQLCINLCVQLKLPLKNSEIDVRTKTRPEEQLTLEVFRAWFKKTFVNAEVDVAPSVHNAPSTTGQTGL